MRNVDTTEDKYFHSIVYLDDFVRHARLVVQERLQVRLRVFLFFRATSRDVKFKKMVDIESMTRYVSPVNPAVFPLLAVVLLGIGIFFTAWFFVYEVTSTKFTRDIFKELLISLVAAIFSGFGVLFLLLWVGIYV
ncbi:transmembrane protein 258 [Polyergus mexicanus]|uniref:transmembrane protein 258 n=2 Tax=Formicini TaxID=72771 RepID=UPI0038B4E44E